MKKAGTILLISAFLLTFMITKSINVMQDTKITGIPAIELLPHPETGVLVPEEWRDIPKSNGQYQISNYGRLKSVVYGKQRLLKTGISDRGYENIRLTVAGYKGTLRIHRLVATAFVPNPDNKPHVNHKKPNKLFNVYFNLEWCTISENLKHAEKMGLRNHPTGNNHHATKINADQVLEIRRLSSSFTQTEIAKKFKMKVCTVQGITSGRNWKYLKEEA